MNFSDHINSVTKKDSQRIGALMRLKNLVPTAAKLQSGHTTSSNLLPFNLAHVTRENWSAFKKEGIG